MLLEDFLDLCQEAFENSDRGKLKSSDLFPALKRYFELIDPFEFQETSELKDYLVKFVSYFSSFEQLPVQRQVLRINNGNKMIGKLRNMFLLRSPGYLETSLPESLNGETNIKYAKGVGEARSRALKSFGINHLEDLLWWLPRDYEDRRRILPLSAIQNEVKATFKAKLLSYSVKKPKGFTIITAVVTDGFGQVLLKWFNQEYIAGYLVKNKEYLVTGVPKKTPFGPFELNSPEIEEATALIKREILPVYSLVSGISQKMARKIVKKNMGIIREIEELIPKDISVKRNLINRKNAAYAIHYPRSFFELNEARRYLSYEELFLFELAILYNKHHTKESVKGVSKIVKGQLAETFIKSLPFKLTGDQVKAFEDIRRDMSSDVPMGRLLQGDVGSGKTVVAELSMIDNYEAGYQSALMVPTSVLANQHYEKLKRDLEPLGIKVELLVGAMKKSNQDFVKSQLEHGEIDIVVGTHALIQENVAFKNLGLVVVDEQHRFGVKQRETLMSKGVMADTLVMTATPIPRTLALTAYGDLDVSTINEMPPGRTPVKTLLITRSRVNELYKFVKDEIEHGHQAFFIYPLVEESEVLDLKAATEEAERLRTQVFTDIGLELLHGRMTDEQKNEIMEKFRIGEAKVMVSTTVIEVGIDIPNATVMVIEHPERFGLAQLHQLRGRVGRSNLKSYCFMVMNGNTSEEATSRLREFTETNDGFKVSELDLRLRGPGEFLGIRQHGLPEFRVADIVRDGELLIEARKDAAAYLSNNNNRISEPGLSKEIKKRFGDSISLIGVG